MHRIRGYVSERNSDEIEAELDIAYEMIFGKVNVNRYKNNRKKDEKCNVCDGELYENRLDGHYVCILCGVVASEPIIDLGPERYNFSDESGCIKNNARSGMENNELLPTMSSGSSFGNGTNGYNMNRRANWMIPYKEKSLYKVFCKIDKYCAECELSTNIAEGAKCIYKNLKEVKLSRGKNLEGVIRGCIYIESNQNTIGNSCSMEKLANIKNEKNEKINVEDIQYGCKIIKKFLRNNTSIKDMNLKIIDPNDLFPRYNKALDLPYKTNYLCKMLLNKINELRCLECHVPQSQAVGIIFYISEYLQLGITKQQIHEKCEGVSIVTITKTYSVLLDYTTELNKVIHSCLIEPISSSNPSVNGLNL